MRPSAIVLVGMLVSCGVLVLAGDADPAPGAVEYTVETPPGALFVETFQGDWESTWTHSQSEAYAGRFAAEPYKVDGISGDVGIAMPEEAKRYGLSRKLDVPVDMTKAPVVVQYEVSLKEGLDCGGAYLKLLNVDGNFRGEDLVESTPYSIMFGPDKCANAGKVHFIVRFRNPVSGEVTEHHLRSPDGHSLKLPPTHDIVPITHLYRFVLLGDNRILISVDDSTPKEVNMLTDLDPPINPSKEIDDPADTKPEDWVDEKEIFDPNQVKPDDWDEDLPIHIPDPDVGAGAASVLTYDTWQCACCSLQLQQLQLLSSSHALHHRKLCLPASSFPAPRRPSSRRTGMMTSRSRSTIPRRRSPRSGMRRTMECGPPPSCQTPSVRA